jgi:hypothetical protein
MTKIGARLAVLLLIAGLFVLKTAEAQEKKIKRQELPPAVEKTVAEQSQGATIKGFSTEVEGGKTLYEVAFCKGGIYETMGDCARIDFPGRFSGLDCVCPRREL